MINLRALRFLYAVASSCLIPLILSCDRRPVETNYFPETGPAAVQQRALQLVNNLNVLSIAIAPGHEDLAALAYFRLSKGANVLSAYLTNGEAGESDISSQYPDFLAANLRLEAEDAIGHLDGEVHFLNFPHVVTAKDSSSLRLKWPSEEVKEKIRELVNQFQPDIILVPQDLALSESMRRDLLQEDLLAVLSTAALTSQESGGASGWEVYKVLLEQKGRKGEQLPITENHDHFGKSYEEMGAEAGQKYVSISIQRQQWLENRSRSYSEITLIESYTNGDGEIPLRHSSNLRSLGSSISRLSRDITDGEKERSLKFIPDLIDSINYKISTRYTLPAIDQRALFQWKKNLEALKCSMLGIEVEFDVSETVLSKRQLTEIRLGNVKGLMDTENASVYFGGKEEGWVVNEGFERKFRYVEGDVYRLLSPEDVTFTYPQSQHGLKLARLRHPFLFFIINQAENREESFIHRSVINFDFADKFSVEILTPIVRIVPGEKLVVRLTNHSRDGVKDTVRVVHEFAESTPGAFRLNEKEATYIDTLTLIWNEFPEDGSYILPLEIQNINVGYFAARKFTANVDLQKTVGVISGLEDNAVEPALRRLGITSKEINPENLSNQTDGLDVLIVDRRALTLIPGLRDKKGELEEFVRRGGHLIYLAQDAEVWNSSEVWKEVELTPSFVLDETTAISAEENHSFMKTPNMLTSEAWEDWLFLRGHNKISVKADNLDIPVKAREMDTAMLVSAQRDLGKLTYVDLALTPQLKNIHAGAFRFFANIISN